MASANQVYHSDSSAPYCGITSEKPKSDSKNELRNILIKAGITLAGTGVVGGGIILTAALLKSKLAPKTNNPPEGPSASEKEHDARMGKEDEQKFLQQLLQMANESAQKLKDYYYPLNEDSKKEIMGFINENFRKSDSPNHGEFLAYLDSFLLNKSPKKIMNNKDWQAIFSTINSSKDDEIPGILKSYIISGLDNSLSEYVPISLISCALVKYGQILESSQFPQEFEGGEILSELASQMYADYTKYCSESTQPVAQEPSPQEPYDDADVMTNSDGATPSPSSSEDDENEVVEPLAGPPSDVQPVAPIQTTEEGQKIPPERLDWYTCTWYEHWLEQNFKNCIYLYGQLSPEERTSIQYENFWEFMNSIFNYFERETNGGTVVKRIDSYDCSTLHDCVKNALQRHGICGLGENGSRWDFQNKENNDPIYKLPRITVRINNEDCTILDFNQLREDFENFANYTPYGDNYLRLCENLQGEFNSCIERIDQAASQPIVSPDPTQVVTESPQQPPVPASPLPDEALQPSQDLDQDTQETNPVDPYPLDAAPIVEQPPLEFPDSTPPLLPFEVQPIAPANLLLDIEPQQLPDSDLSTQRTGLEEQNPFSGATLIEKPVPLTTSPLSPTVDQPAQEPSQVNDIQFDPNSVTEPNLDSTGDDKSYDSDYDSESEYTSSSTTSEDDD